MTVDEIKGKYALKAAAAPAAEKDMASKQSRADNRKYLHQKESGIH